MQPITTTVLAFFIGCATPQTMDTGEERARPRIPAFSADHENLTAEACYPGHSDFGPICLPAKPLDFDTDGYSYPTVDDPQYAEPTAYLDLRALSQGTSLSHHLKLSEFAAPHQGRFAVIQPHLVEAVQAIRDELGPVVIGSGYRSPGYNRRVGGVHLSRHQYGDAVDIWAIEASLDEVQMACRDEGATFIEAYSSHVHCDWRDEPLDSAFYDKSDHSDQPDSTDNDHSMHEHEYGLWNAETVAL
jgi:hypothetical protein